MQPAKHDLHIVQGSTLRDTLRLMHPCYEYRPFSNMRGVTPSRREPPPRAGFFVPGDSHAASLP